MNTVIVGLGYVGLPLAVAASEVHTVTGVDVNEQKIQRLNGGDSVVEDVSDDEIRDSLATYTMSFEDVSDADIVVLCVPTPVKNKHPDLQYIEKAGRSVAEHISTGAVVILESTVNPGVSEKVLVPILEEYSGLVAGEDFDVAHCPERIDPGNTEWTVQNIPRNLGATSEEGGKKAKRFYEAFINAQINVVSSLKAAEATKVVENTFRDVNIAFVNELAKSFDVLGLDVKEVIAGAATKPFGFLAHWPGCGVGGHCIPVDPYYLIEEAEANGFDHEFLRLARTINDSMPRYAVQRLMELLNELGKPVKGTTVALLGLSYKANVADLRESPSLIIQEILEERGANVVAVDPHVESAVTLKEGLEAEAAILATNHDEFLNVTDWGSVQAVVDGRNCLNEDQLENQGVLYAGIGR